LPQQNVHPTINGTSVLSTSEVRVTTILVLQLEIIKKVQMSGGLKRHDFRKILMKIYQLLQNVLWGRGYRMDEHPAVTILPAYF
jgi:hypothetical protein